MKVFNTILAGTFCILIIRYFATKQCGSSDCLKDMENQAGKWVLIAGGRGMIGRALAKQFESKGFRVRFLSRNPPKDDAHTYFWDPLDGKIDENAFREVEILVNLAGEGIADKLWTPWRKRKIINSRVLASKLLFKTLEGLNHKIKVVINASAIGIYGNTGDMIIHEDAVYSNDFLGSTCQRWEKNSLNYTNLGLRTVIFRIGLVLSTKGGMLPELLKPLKFGVATVFGKGDQYQSWIHIDDLCRMIVKAGREEQYSGIYNAVAPGPLSQRNFMKLLTQILQGNYLFIPVPAFILKLFLGEMSKLVLEGSRVSPEKIEKTGFKFNFPQANLALRNLLGK